MFANPAAKDAMGSAIKTRSVAKDRLSVILASQRGTELMAGVDMEALQKDVMVVVQVSLKDVELLLSFFFQLSFSAALCIFAKLGRDT